MSIVNLPRDSLRCLFGAIATPLKHEVKEDTEVVHFRQLPVLRDSSLELVVTESTKLKDDVCLSEKSPWKNVMSSQVDFLMTFWAGQFRSFRLCKDLFPKTDIIYSIF